ncbi:MAG: Metal-dependent hydrolase [Parcubacteria group bacterium GW2011_GWA2_47_12]|nr:MAG: Metal-dependent hydrolase [Parcubacteria group bacterium GW2011_GWA2_47_12]
MHGVHEVPERYRVARMQNEVKTSAGVFAYKIQRVARARRLTIAVRAGGEILITAPARLGEGEIKNLFEKRAARIARAVAYFSRLPKPTALPVVTHTERAALEEKLNALVARAASSLCIKTPLFTIKAMRSRFGSCSSRGALSFSDSLRALPPELSEYIAIHEVCHCIEHNHSSAFWVLVEKLVPDWRVRRQALKKYNFVMHK